MASCNVLVFLLIHSVSVWNNTRALVLHFLKSFLMKFDFFSYFGVDFVLVGW